MKKGELYIVLLSLILCAGCYKEDTLKSRERGEESSIIPLGDHEYDHRIVNWYDHTGTFILYKFSKRDAYWTKTGWNEAIFAENKNTIGMLIEPAKEECVEKLLNFVEKNYLNFFPNDFLQKVLPRWILLCSTLQDYYENVPRPFMYYSGKDVFYFGYGDDRLDALTAVDKKNMRNDLLYKTIEDAFKAGVIEIPEEFAAVSNYGVDIASSEMYEKGFLEAGIAKMLTPSRDWTRYIKYIVQNSYADLIAEPTTAEWTTAKGILHPSKDSKGFVRKKYDIVVKYFKEKRGIDLQAMGNYKDEL